MNRTNNNFSLTEEAFLLSSLNEVVKVWARGTGQASFDLNISDGVAELKLGFKLGHPSEPHCHPPAPAHQPQEELHQHHRRRQKAAGRRVRDQQRAQQHQAGLQAAAPAEVVILPVTGKLLPVRKPQTPARNRNISSSQAAAPAAVSPPPAASLILPDASPQASVPPAVSIPVKAAQTSRKYNDVNIAKKNLFSLPSQHHRPQDFPALNSEKKFHKREYELWTKLFET